MRRVALPLLLLAAISFLRNANAQAPQGFNYQAIARTNAGIILPNQNVGLRFTITNGNGGSILYEETQAAATNQFGLFTVNIGSGNVIAGTFSNISWSTVTPWLKVDMDASGGTTYIFMGTSQLLSVPYALYAANAPKSGGTLDSAYNYGGAGAGRVITANSGSVLINTSTNSQAGLAVSTTANGVAIAAASTLPGTTFPTIQATTATNSNTVAAVIGDASAAGIGIAGQVESSGTTGAVPVLGNNLRTTGGSGVEGDGFNGIDGEAFNVSGFGVYGNNNDAASGSSPNNLAAGVNGIGFTGTLGQTINNGGFGVLGVNLAPNRTGTYDNAGVEGQGFYGVEGSSNSPGAGFAVVANGDLGATGNLVVAGTKSFQIDDPLDPANKFLKHFCIESNGVLNIYRGRVFLDANGEAIVELPAYFTAININFTYQLTAIGQPGPSLYIKSEIENNKFVISGGKPNQKVNWEVTAERNDLYLQHHPEAKVNEVAKSPAQAGKYMHPLEYGKPESDCIVSPPKINSVATMKEAKPVGSGRTLNIINDSSNK